MMPIPEQDSLTSSRYDALPKDYETYLQGQHLTCAVETTIKIISGRWKVLIIRELLLGTRRFNQLHQSLQGISHKILTQHLRELERDGIVARKDYHELPPKVEYSLTPLGETLHPVIDLMHRWGLAYLQRGARSYQEL